MLETAPISTLPGTSSGEKSTAKKPKKLTGSSKVHESSDPNVTKLITKAVSASKKCKGLFLATLKKALSTRGYNVEKNSHIKLGLKSLVSKGILVQTKGTGASGSFKFSKKPNETNEKVQKEKTVSKSKIPAVKQPKRVAIVKKSPKKSKKAAASTAKSPKKVKTLMPKKALKSPAEAVKAKCVNSTKPKAKEAVPKK